MSWAIHMTHDSWVINYGEHSFYDVKDDWDALKVCLKNDVCDWWANQMEETVDQWNTFNMIFCNMKPFWKFWIYSFDSTRP